MPKLIDYKEKYLDKEKGVTIPTIAIFDAVKVGNYQIHETIISDRIDILAKVYYNDSSLWWVIALVNDLSDPIIDLKPRKKLIIPRLT